MCQLWSLPADTSPLTCRPCSGSTGHFTGTARPDPSRSSASASTSGEAAGWGGGDSFSTGRTPALGHDRLNWTRPATLGGHQASPGLPHHQVECLKGSWGSGEGPRGTEATIQLPPCSPPLSLTNVPGTVSQWVTSLPPPLHLQGSCTQEPVGFHTQTRSCHSRLALYGEWAPSPASREASCQVLPLFCSCPAKTVSLTQRHLSGPQGRLSRPHTPGLDSQASPRERKEKFLQFKGDVLSRKATDVASLC